MQIFQASWNALETFCSISKFEKMIQLVSLTALQPVGWGKLDVIKNAIWPRSGGVSKSMAFYKMCMIPKKDRVDDAYSNSFGITSDIVKFENFGSSTV